MDGAIAEPDGNMTTVDQLRAYHFIYQLAAELARGNRDARERPLELQRMAAG